MRRTYIIPLIVLIASLGLVGLLLLSGGRSRGPAYRLAGLPTPGLVAPLTTPTPARDAFMEYFPQIGTPTRGPTASPTPGFHAAGPTATPTLGREISEDQPAKNVLLTVLWDWNYTDYTQIGTTKRGRLEHVRTKEQRQIWEGLELEHDVIVASLSPEAAIMQLEDATFPLRIVRKPAFFDELMKKPRPLTPEEQREALDYYMRLHGDRMRELSKYYKPLPGLNLPSSPPTQEQVQKNKERYMQMYGQRFKQEQSLRATSRRSSPEQQRQSFERYWKTFRPGEPMPPLPVQPNGSFQRFPLMLPTEKPLKTAQ